MRAPLATAASIAALLPLCACIGLHMAGSNPLQIHPSFSGKSVTLFPAHAPGHDTEDVSHLIPQLKHSLYYTQEGHRPALHGAKHANLDVQYVRPTVMLDHTSHLDKIDCRDSNITLCFGTDEAYKAAEKTWNNGEFNIGTYHAGCGDVTTGKRSYFHVSEVPKFEAQSRCVTVTTTPIKDNEAFDSGEITFGTFNDPANRRRVPTMGHVYMMDNNEEVDAGDKTEDLDEDLGARKTFFNNKNLKSKEGDTTVKEFEFVSPDGKVNKRGEGLFQGLYDSIVEFFDDVESYLKAFRTAVLAVSHVIIEVGIVGVKAVGAVFGVPFKHSYRVDIPVSYYLKGSGDNEAPAIFGNDPGYTIKDFGNGAKLQCSKCGIAGDFSIQGRLAFTISEGVSEGHIGLVNVQPFRIDAQFGLTLEKSKARPVLPLSKQLGAFPLTPLVIPGVITVGPQVTVSTAFDLSLDGQAQLLLGGYVMFQPGKVELDVIQSNKSATEGLDPEFVPVFNVSGSLNATAQFAMPVALELAIDVFSGTFKLASSFVNKPSIYAKAIATINERETCNNGVELRAGIRNQIYFTPIEGKTDPIDVSNEILYEHGIGCISATGFNATDVTDDKGVFDAVIKELGTDIGKTAPGYVTDSRAVEIAESKVGFRLIMDDDKSSVLVTGTDGYIYLANTKENYDFSSPWGSVKPDSNVVDLDVLGRIVSYKFSTKSVLAAQVKVFKPSKVPKDFHASGLVIAQGDNAKHYAVILKSEKVSDILYPTFCKTDEGFRLFATKLAYTKDGVPDLKKAKSQKKLMQVKLGLEGLGVKDTKTCRTVKMSGSV